MRLVGLVTAAATVRDRDALAAAFWDLDADEARALGAAAGVVLERQASETGDWRAWAELWYPAQIATRWEAAAGFRERLDAAANKRRQQRRLSPAEREWEALMRHQDADCAEHDLRQAVRPLMRRGASKAEIEEAAGRVADDLIEWPRIFAILIEELGAARRSEVAHHG